MVERHVVACSGQVTDLMIAQAPLAAEEENPVAAQEARDRAERRAARSVRGFSVGSQAPPSHFGDKKTIYDPKHSPKILK